MASKYKSLAALGLSTTLLGGLVACGNDVETTPAPAETAAAEDTDTAATQTPDAQTDTSTYAMSGGEGEGEGGEGEGGEGEGGEGGVDLAAAAQDPAVYRSALAMTEAHIRAGIDALDAGERRAAGEMFAHPVSEILLDFEPVLVQQGVEPFAQKLSDASAAVFAEESAQDLRARAEDIIDTLRAAAEKAPEGSDSEAVVEGKVIADQIDRATAQYDSASRTDAYEPYLDGYGFYKTANALLEDHRADIEADAPEFVEQADAVLAILAEAYPTADRPDTLDADQSVMAAGNSELQLIVSGL
ncbi:hypothetical protein [Henriciella marina]|uniref:Lipoprotein n=1 Tax=Henriciella marina TaxID=453851 RepID=A0ABT4LZ26_9PROT|nr:hypothetical protein [Henriciella marina]MCZ4299387.1 hypothetical protein [Henriciella marina]